MDTALACLPAGGLQCERMVEIACAELGAALGKQPGLRGMRTDDNKPAPHDNLDTIAAEIMSEAGPALVDVGAFS